MKQCICGGWCIRYPIIPPLWQSILVILKSSARCWWRLLLLLYHFKKCTKRRILDGGRREKQYYAVLRFSFLHNNKSMKRLSLWSAAFTLNHYKIAAFSGGFQSMYTSKVLKILHWLETVLTISISTATFGKEQALTSLSFGHTHSIVDPKLIFWIRFTKPLYWWEKGGRDCGGLRRFGESDPKDQLRINNRVCVAEALTSDTSETGRPPSTAGRQGCQNKHPVHPTYVGTFHHIQHRSTKNFINRFMTSLNIWQPS